MTKNKPMAGKYKSAIFYILMAALPVTQILVFYFYVNLKSFALSFQEYDLISNTYSFAGFKNFANVFKEIRGKDYLLSSIGNSLSLFAFSFVFGGLLSVIFSYYIYKKRFFAGAFKIVLYLPQILSSAVFVILYKYFMENAIPEIVWIFNGKEGDKISGLLYDVSNIKRMRILIMIFSTYIGFGTSVLMYSGTMSGISESIIESGKLEGITPMKELVFIVIPLIWPTFVTFTIASLTGIFTNQMDLYTIYGANAEYKLYTFGYYLYKQALDLEGEFVKYPFLSAMGMAMTVVAIPITLGARYLLNKFGPSTD